MKTPGELAIKEKEERAKSNKQRVKDITTKIEALMDGAILEEKVTSKGGRIEYKDFFRDYEVCIVEDFLRKYNWTCVYNPQEHKLQKSDGSNKAYTKHFFDIKPLKKK